MDSDVKGMWLISLYISEHNKATFHAGLNILTHLIFSVRGPCLKMVPALKGLISQRKNELKLLDIVIQ